jgi:hypothetical protein
LRVDCGNALAQEAGGDDPCPGVVKRLVVDFSAPGSNRTQASAAENEVLWVIDANKMNSDSLTIHGAWYGDPDRLYGDDGCKDVSELVREAVEGCELHFEVTNDSCGGDPVPGVGKVLVVEYQAPGGPVSQMLAKEGGQIDIEEEDRVYEDENGERKVYGSFDPLASGQLIREAAGKDFEMRIAELEASLEETSSQLEAKNAEFGELEESSNAKDAEIEALTAQLEAKQEEVDGLSEVNVEELQQQVSFMETAKAEDEETINMLREKVEELEGACAAAAESTETEELEAQVSDLNSKLDEVRGQAKEQTERAAKFEANMDQLEELESFQTEAARVPGLYTRVEGLKGVIACMDSVIIHRACSGTFSTNNVSGSCISCWYRLTCVARNSAWII